MREITAHPSNRAAPAGHEGYTMCLGRGSRCLVQIFHMGLWIGTLVCKVKVCECSGGVKVDRAYFGGGMQVYVVVD